MIGLSERTCMRSKISTARRLSPQPVLSPAAAGGHQESIQVPVILLRWTRD